MIRIEVLGPFRVLDAHGREVDLPRGKLTGLLAYLASEPHGVERDALEAVFWPDSAPRARRQSLRQALYSVRRALDEQDPFVVADRVRLDPSQASTDVAELREALAEGDEESALRCFRGIPYTDVPSDASVALERWLERRREEELQRLAGVVERAARDALDAGDERRARRLVHRGVQAGLDEGALQATIYGANAVESVWPAARIGPDALEALVYRARPGLPPLSAVVLEDHEGWTRTLVLEEVVTLPAESRPAVVELPAAGGATGEVAALLRSLMQLPGGAAVGESTIRTVRRLDALAPTDDLEPHRREAEAALTDALDAALHEQALIVLGDAEALRVVTSTVVAHAVARQGGEGLTFVVSGPDERSLSTLPARTLLQTVPDVRAIRQSPTGPAAVAVAPGGDPETEAGSDGARAPAPRSWKRRAAGVVAVVSVIVGAGAAVTLLDEGAVAAHDVIICSPRSGFHQYYRWSPGPGMLERFAQDTAAHLGDDTCRGEGGLRIGDSVYLATVARDTFVWRAYPDRWSRGDLVGRPLPARFTTAPGVPFRMRDGRGAILANWGVRWRLTELDTGSSRALSGAGGDDYFLSASAPWIVFRRRGGDGVWDLYRIHIHADSVEQLTDHPMDESWGVLQGDSMVFARGAMGDDEDGSLELFLRELSSGREVRLTDNPWNDYEVEWSPDGRHICWQSEELGHYQSEIMVMELETRRVWNLSDREGRDHLCGFTPDGEGVVYRSLRGAITDLNLKPVSGGDARNLHLMEAGDRLTVFAASGTEKPYP